MLLDKNATKYNIKKKIAEKVSFLAKTISPYNNMIHSY